MRPRGAYPFGMWNRERTRINANENDRNLGEGRQLFILFPLETENLNLESSFHDCIRDRVI